MIIGHFEHWERDRNLFSPMLCGWLEILKEIISEPFQCGEFNITDRVRLIVKEAVTVPATQVLGEFHEDHVDIHYVLEGEEWMGLGQRPGQRPDSDLALVPVDPPLDDHVFLSRLEEERIVSLKPGMYIVLMPGEAHKPCCSMNGGGNVRKAILKINIK
ncbi:hypothetical protein SY83_21945 [Paenibacillus swuensis]|uniref:YhcH/YjgK/YiaL family protein n=1 Tax=Paenibacillus swuensis TaxID=1178515 RepID=A0A172TNN2_9BACL|nr:YhcH/YjgK/YiaL family protein [Paenibacillus swuensis]ANE48504.1 hypothetical protein SY83_21945 [Paenibacillus swuensis]